MWASIVIWSGMADHSIVYAKDFVDALKKKYASNSYKKMVSILEYFTLTNKIKNHQINQGNSKCLFHWLFIQWKIGDICGSMLFCKLIRRASSK